MIKSTWFTRLHGSEYLGMVEIVGSLGMGKCHLSLTYLVGNTAVSWAARKGIGLW